MYMWGLTLSSRGYTVKHFKNKKVNEIRGFRDKMEWIKEKPRKVSKNPMPLIFRELFQQVLFMTARYVFLNSSM